MKSKMEQEEPTFKGFIKEYWKKHLGLIFVSMSSLILSWVLAIELGWYEAIRGMGFFVLMCFVCTGYIILRDATRYEDSFQEMPGEASQ